MKRFRWPQIPYRDRWVAVLMWQLMTLVGLAGSLLTPVREPGALLAAVVLTVGLCTTAAIKCLNRGSSYSWWAFAVGTCAQAALCYLAYGGTSGGLVALVLAAVGLGLAILARPMAPRPAATDRESII